MRRTRTKKRLALLLAFIAGGCVAFAGDVSYFYGSPVVNFDDLLRSQSQSIDFVAPVSLISPSALLVTSTPPANPLVGNGSSYLGTLGSAFAPVGSSPNVGSPINWDSGLSYLAQYSPSGGTGVTSPPSGGSELLGLLPVTPLYGFYSVSPAFVTSPILITPTHPATMPVGVLENPETSTWGLVLGGLAVVFFLRRKLAVN